MEFNYNKVKAEAEKYADTIVSGSDMIARTIRTAVVNAYIEGASAMVKPNKLTWDKLGLGDKVYRLMENAQGEDEVVECVIVDRMVYNATSGLLDIGIAPADKSQKWAHLTMYNVEPKEDSFIKEFFTTEKAAKTWLNTLKYVKGKM